MKRRTTMRRSWSSGTAASRKPRRRKGRVIHKQARARVYQFQIQNGQVFATRTRHKGGACRRHGDGVYVSLRRVVSALCLPLACLLALSAGAAAADYRITRDHGGLVDQYK